MRPAWNAGVTRARLLLGRTLGAEHAQAVAVCRSLAEGVGALAGSAYGERVRPGTELAIAERGIAETLLWHLRILAGWLPGAGAALVQALGGWFELANIDARLAALAGDGREPSPFVLGRLATAWGRIEQLRSIEELGDVVAASAWGDPGGRTAAALAIGLRVGWACRVQQTAPQTADWVVGAGALLVARELLVEGTRDHVAQLGSLPGIGEQALAASSLREMQAALPPTAAWSLAGVSNPSELWQAELGWWDRVERDALRLLHSRSDDTVVLAVVALLAVDAQRATRALEAAARGGASELKELVGGAV